MAMAISGNAKLHRTAAWSSVNWRAGHIVPVKISVDTPSRTADGAHRNQSRSCPRVQGRGELLSMARQTPRQISRNLDQDPQGGFRPEIDHAEAGHRRRALLGVDRWPSQ